MKNRAIRWSAAVLFSFVAGGCGDERSGAQQVQKILPDTEANRAAQAVRYLSAVPPRELFRDMAENPAATMPGAQTAALEKVLIEYIDVESFESFLRDSMVRHFSAEELRALADFYGSAVGKSAMEKFGEYMADVMPFVREQVAQAIEKSTVEDE